VCVIIDRRLTIRLLLTQWRCCVFLQFLRLLGSLFSCHWVSDKASHDGGRKKRVSTDDLYGVTNTKSQYNHLQMLHRTPSTRAHWPYLQERLPCWVCNQTVKRNASYFASHWPYQSLRKTVAEISCARKQFRAAELLFFFLVWNYLVVKMRFERPTCCIGRGTFCIQVSCSNSSAISPTESQSTYSYTTPIIAIF